MKHLKILGIAAVAAMALMAFAASSASATALYNGTTKLGVGSVLDFSLKSGTNALLVNTKGEELDKCTGSTVKGSITNAGGAGTAVSGSISELTWTGCTFTTTTTVKGGLEVIQTGTTTNGVVKSNAEIGVTINTVLFGSCVYGVAKGTELGTLTTNSTTNATFDANAVAIKLSGSNFACPETSKWTGTYVSTTPVNLRVEAS
jgi:hypothetical protein